jgi:gas vesicle protein
MYDQYESYLDEAYPDDDAEDDEFTAYRKEYDRWEEADSRRSVDFDNSDGRTIAARTADESLIKAVRTIANRVRDSVSAWEEDLYAQMTTREVAARLDGVAQAAVDLVETYMRQDSDGFFDEAAEELALIRMEDQLGHMLDPN